MLQLASINWQPVMIADLARRHFVQMTKSPKFCHAFDSFKDEPVKITRIAQFLGIRVSMDQTLSRQVLLRNSQKRSEILIGKNINPLRGRFAVAHEIGHWYLLKAEPVLARTWERSKREQYANAFARQLLIPLDRRKKIFETFCGSSDVDRLLAVSQMLGIHPKTFLAFAQDEPHWMDGSKNIWLQVKNSSNKFTELEPRPRVIAAFYDRGRFFLPTNQSICSVFGTDRFLGDLDVGVSSSIPTPSRIHLYEKTASGRPRYKKTEHIIKCNGMRLPGHTGDQKPIFWLLIHSIGPS